MQMTLDDLFADPRWMLFSYEGDHVRFARMDRASFANSIFVDTRIQPADPQMVRVPLMALIERIDQAPPPPPGLGFIHHMAQMGSTLLARAIDLPGRNLVQREPLHLRQLGVAASAAGPEGPPLIWRAMMRLSLTMLAKTFADGQPNVVKGNVPISLIAGDIDEIDPAQPLILMHYSLDDYLAAVLRTLDHQNWVRKVADEVAVGRDPAIGAIDTLGAAEQAAALWLAMVARFERVLGENPNARSLDANVLFDRPAETIVAAARHFGSPIERGAADEIAAGPLFATYGKDPSRAYDPQLRVERRAEAKQRLAPDIARARRWVEERAGQVELGAALPRPLLGEAVSLLGTA